MAMSLKFFNIPPPYGNTRKRKQVKRACSNCKLAHAGCDAKRPCSRCVAKKQEATCQEWTPEEELQNSSSARDPSQPITQSQIHSEPVLQKRPRVDAPIRDHSISASLYTPEPMEIQHERRSISESNLNVQFTSEFGTKKRLVDYPTPHLRAEPSTDLHHFSIEIPAQPELRGGTHELHKLREEIHTLRESNHQLEDFVKGTLLRTSPALPSQPPTSMFPVQASVNPLYTSPTPAGISSGVQLPSLTRPFADAPPAPGTPTSFLYDPLASPSVAFPRIDGFGKSLSISKTQNAAELPVLPGENSNLPPEVFPYTSQYMSSYTSQANRWYRFTSTPESLVPTSCWLIRKTGRADDWRLIECNDTFLQLLQSPVTEVAGISFLDLVPPKFKSSTCELLQHIIRSNAATAEAKSIWKTSGTDIGVCSSYRVYILNKISNASRCNHNRDPDALDQKILSAIRSCNGSGVLSTSCETTGCGAFGTEWRNVVHECDHTKEPRQTQTFTSHTHSIAALTCSDQASISVSERNADRIVWAKHHLVDSYDDYMQIGDVIHPRTFSMDVSTILSLGNTTAQPLRLRGKKT